MLCFVNGNIIPHVQRLVTAKSSNTELQLLVSFLTTPSFKPTLAAIPPGGEQSKSG